MKRGGGLAYKPVQRSWRTVGSTLRLLVASLLLALVSLASLAQAANLETYQPIIGDAAHRFAMPAHWISAIIDAESDADPAAVSHKGAMGLMQIMPDTWQELRDQYALEPDPFAPVDNIMAGTAYLRQMLDRYGSIALMLAAYNAGPGRVDEHLTAGRALPLETLDYVANLLPRLSSDHRVATDVAVRNVLANPVASTIFVPSGVGFLDARQQQRERNSGLDPAVTVDHSSPSNRDYQMTGNPLFVRPSTRAGP